MMIKKIKKISHENCLNAILDLFKIHRPLKKKNLYCEIN